MKTTEVPLTIEPATDVINVIRASEEDHRRPIREYGSFVFSAVLHASILIIMALCVFPSTVARRIELEAAFNAGEGDASDEFLFQDEAAPVLPVKFEMSTPMLVMNSELPDLDVALARDMALIRSASSTEVNPGPAAAPAASPDAGAEPSLAASSIEEAVDRVAGSIEGRLQDGDLLVGWLLDASQSVAEDRQRLATQLESSLQHFVGGASSHHQLLHAVVSFGDAMEERVAPTESPGTVLDSIRELPVDPSGKENVFGAIEQCVGRYRKKWPDTQLMIVVLTDESGDDTAKLEHTIRVCREHAVPVSVIGPPAVLGADTGVYLYHDPQSHQILPLPVKRGPDSALSERLELDYWFLTRKPQADIDVTRGFGGTDLPSWYGDDDQSIPGHRCIAATEVDLPSWYGGPDLEGLVSGFSPYALTRLTSQTGGTYIIVDANEDEPFPAAAMRAYAPDYQSLDEYLDDVHSHPLRHAVMEAVKVAQNKELGPPPTILFGKQSESPPYGFMRTYLTPAGFVRRFRKIRHRLKAQADRTTRIVEQALAQVSQPGSVEYGLEYEYQRESSPRWRAWYDLTRGRLLATSVRLEEYRLACDMVMKRGFLDEATNHLMFVPEREMKSDSSFRRRAEEAERLLMRCVRENPNTPWAWLAQRELDYGLGIKVRQHTLTLVVMPTSRVRQPRLPKL